MKKSIILSAVLFAIFTIMIVGTSSTTANAASKNLLKNPGAETGNLKGWKDSSSEKCWMVGYKGSIKGWEHPAAKSGKYYFMTGWPSQREKKRYLYQDVKITAYRGNKLTFSGYIGGYGHSDKGGIRLELRTKKGKVLSSKASKLFEVSWGDWSKKVSVSLTVPSNAYYARVYLVGALYQGDEADAYFDNLSLIASGVSAPEKVIITKTKALKGRKIYIKWKKINDANGFEAQYSTSKKKLKRSIVYTTSKNLDYAYIPKTKQGKTYYFRVRAYKLNGKTKVYGPWSEIRSATAK